MLQKANEKPAEGASKRAADKRGNFIRLAERRTINAIRAIRVIGKLGNKNAYEYDEADVKKIVSALNREIEALRTRMASSGAKEGIDFKL